MKCIRQHAVVQNIRHLLKDRFWQTAVEFQHAARFLQRIPKKSGLHYTCKFLFAPVSDTFLQAFEL